MADSPQKSRDRLKTLKKLFPIEGLGWRLLFFGLPTAAILVGAVVSAWLWLRDPVKEFLNSDVKVWHVLAGIALGLLLLLITWIGPGFWRWITLPYHKWRSKRSADASASIKVEELTTRLEDAEQQRQLDVQRLEEQHAADLAKLQDQHSKQVDELRQDMMRLLQERPTPTPVPNTVSKPVEPHHVIAIDTDTTGNDARLTGGVDVQNCHELATGGTLDIDVLLLPPGVSAPGMTGFGFVLNFDPGVVHVTTVNLECVIKQGENDALFIVSDPVPNSTGRLRCDAANLGSATVVGGGILARITLSAVGSGRSDLTLSELVFLDPLANELPVAEIISASIVVDGQCT